LKKEKIGTSDFIFSLQTGYGKDKKFLRIKVPLRFKIPSYTNIKELVNAYIQIKAS